MSNFITMLADGKIDSDKVIEYTNDLFKSATTILWSIVGGVIGVVLVIWAISWFWAAGTKDEEKLEKLKLYFKYILIGVGILALSGGLINLILLAIEPEKVVVKGPSSNAIYFIKQGLLGMNYGNWKYL